MINKLQEILAIREVDTSNVWHIRVEVMRDDSIWLGTAIACCDTEIAPVLKAMSYGATAEDVESIAIKTIREAIATAESLSDKEREL